MSYYKLLLSAIADSNSFFSCKRKQQITEKVP